MGSAHLGGMMAKHFCDADPIASVVNDRRPYARCMGAVMRCGFLVITPASGWKVTRAIPGGGLTLQSPRDHGTFAFSIVNMPEELGVLDAPRLRHRARERPQFRFFTEKRFDETEWVLGETQYIAFSSIKSAAPATFAKKATADLQADLKRFSKLLKRVIVSRDWSVARGRRLADITYAFVEEPDVVFAPDGKEVERSHAETIAADILDCEQMVRSLRFERELEKGDSG